MKYELKTLQEKIGKTSLQIRCLKDLDETIDSLFSEIEKGADPKALEDECPYFGVIWPAARVLAEQVEGLPNLKGKNILELGCGLALPSLVLGKKGIPVLATDFHPEVPRFMEANRELNEISRIKYMPWDWKNEPLAPSAPYDFIVASDVLYEKHHPESLSQSVVQSLAPDGEFWLTDPGRPYFEPLIELMHRNHFKSEIQLIDRVFLVKFSKVQS